MRRSLAVIIAGAAALALPAANALAQGRSTSDAPVDFMMRGTSDPADQDLLEPAAPEEPQAPPPPPGAPYPRADAEIGPPLAGPTGEEPLGPPLAGPTPVTAPRADARTGPVVDGRRLLRRARKQADEEDPFAAPGIRVGTFILRPTIDTGVIVSDNPDGDTKKNWETGALVEPTLNLTSDWSRHEVSLDLRGTASFYPDDTFDDREATARFRGRLDITRDTDLTAEAGYAYALESFTDPETPAAAVERPARQTFDASLTGTHRMNRLGLSLGGKAEREIYEDFNTASGGTISQEDRNRTDISATARASYQLSGALEPFAQARLGTIAYDQSVDSAGYRRASTYGELSGGLIFDLSPKLQGEVSAGWRHQEYDDARLKSLDAPVLAAALMWSPRRLTELRLDLATTADGTTIPGASGSVTYSADLTAERQLGYRLTAEAGLGLDYRDYIGTDLQETTWSAFGGLAYNLNRYAALVGRYTYERVETDPGDRRDTNTFTVRLRLKR
ncbi:outer membrane beta-barrel protein [Afifella sp. IM 167]|uniref:outer membrane beta-barrel protein n=1 Tax=Afifella sp. IM 167 TaxID=2033586 RepID=UPI001CCBA757|nr:outer membrane beta-barrel protein [Afifella sp. IM 167]